MAETLLEKAQRLGIQPVGQPTNQAPSVTQQSETLLQKAQRMGIEPEGKPDGAIKSLAKDAFKTVIAKPAVRLGQVAGVGIAKLAGATDEQIGRGLNADVKIPGLGVNVEAQKGFGQGGAKQITSDALKSASYLYTPGKVANQAVSVFKKPILNAGARFATDGAVGGALYGAGESLEREDGEFIKDTAIGAGVGALGGFGLGVGGASAVKLAQPLRGAFGKGTRAVTSKIDDFRGQKVAQKADELSMLQKGEPDARVATQKLEQGLPVKDKVASEAVRQGVPEADTAAIKQMTPNDRTAAQRMLEIREKGLTNKNYARDNRASDVVGETVASRIKFVEKANNNAGKRLGLEAEKLAGQKLSSQKTSLPLKKLTDDLYASGVSIDQKGNLVFKNSDFEGLTPIQKSIVNVWNRAKRVAQTGDALQHHRVKKAIDEVVDFGKKADGLTGRAQNILKGYRSAVDNILDTTYPAYNRANIDFAETRQVLNSVSDLMGKSRVLGEEFVDKHFGRKVSRGIFSNNDRRELFMQMVDELDDVARRQGMEITDNIKDQASFATTLEELLGSDAPTSFGGIIQNKLETAQNIGEVTKHALSGKPVAAAFKAADLGLKKFRGINQQSQIKSLKGLLKDKPSNFGVPKKVKPPKPKAPKSKPTTKKKPAKAFTKSDKVKKDSVVSGSDTKKSNVKKSKQNDVVKSVRAKGVTSYTDADIKKIEKKMIGDKSKAVLIDSDAIKQAHPDFDPKKPQILHKDSSKISVVLFEKAIKEDTSGVVKFTAGGAGSGKSEVIVDKIKNQPSVIFDGTFKDMAKSSESIDFALKNGKKIEIHVVYSPVELASLFNQMRKRTVPIDAFVDTHTGYRGTLPELYKKYGNKIKWDIYANKKFGVMGGEKVKVKNIGEHLLNEKKNVNEVKNSAELIILKIEKRGIDWVKNNINNMLDVL